MMTRKESASSNIITEEMLADSLKAIMKELTSNDYEIALELQQKEDKEYIESLNESLGFLKASFSMVENNISSTDNTVVEVDTPHDGSCLFYSVVLSVLLPVLNSPSFDENFTRLFGPDENPEHLQQLLQNYNGRIDYLKQSELTRLINQRLRPRLAGFISFNRAFFSRYFEGDPAFNQHVATITQPGAWGDQIEIVALSHFLNININVYTDLNEDPVEHPPPNGSDTTISLVFTSASNKKNGKKNHYHYLIDPKLIPGIELASEQNNTNCSSSSNAKTIEEEENAINLKHSKAVRSSTPKWQKLYDNSKQSEELQNKETDLFSYENLHKELIDTNEVRGKSLEANINGTACIARRGGAFLQGVDFIYFMTVPSSSKSSSEEGMAFQKRKLKLHIALPEDDLKLRAAGWNCVKNILIQHEVALSKVLRNGIKMSESKLSGQEAGGQRGKDITIYVDNNSNLKFGDWLTIIDEITKAFQQENIPMGLLPATTGARACKTILNNPYCTYRYEADDDAKNKDFSDPFGEHLQQVDNPELCWDTNQVINIQPFNIQEEELIVNPESNETNQPHSPLEESSSSEDEEKEEASCKSCCDLQ